MSLITELKTNYSKAYKYFEIFYNDEFENKIEGVQFDSLPFEYQLGVFIAFFNTINSDLQFYATNFDVLQESIREAFETYQEYLFLDS